MVFLKIFGIAVLIFIIIVAIIALDDIIDFIKKITNKPSDIEKLWQRYNELDDQIRVYADAWHTVHQGEYICISNDDLYNLMKQAQEKIQKQILDIEAVSAIKKIQEINDLHQDIDVRFEIDRLKAFAELENKENGK